MACCLMSPSHYQNQCWFIINKILLHFPRCPWINILIYGLTMIRSALEWFVLLLSMSGAGRPHLCCARVAAQTTPVQTVWVVNFCYTMKTRPHTSHPKCTISFYRADSRLAPSQWETLLQSNAVSHWLCANLESALFLTMSLTTHNEIQSCIYLTHAITAEYNI